MGDINSRLIALSLAKIAPEAMAKFILDQPSLDAYMKNLNLAIDEEVKKKNAISEETKQAIDKQPAIGDM